MSHFQIYCPRAVTPEELQDFCTTHGGRWEQTAGGFSGTFDIPVAKSPRVPIRLSRKFPKVIGAFFAELLLRVLDDDGILTLELSGITAPEQFFFVEGELEEIEAVIGQSTKSVVDFSWLVNTGSPAGTYLEELLGDAVKRWPGYVIDDASGLWGETFASYVPEEQVLTCGSYNGDSYDLVLKPLNQPGT